MGRRKPKTQPTRVASGGDFGERKAMVQAQEAAPLPVANTAQAPAPRPPGPPASGAFGPTDRPQEPPTAGVNFGPGPGAPVGAPQDVDEALRIMYAQTRHPDLLAMIERRQARR